MVHRFTYHKVMRDGRIVGYGVVDTLNSTFKVYSIAEAVMLFGRRHGFGIHKASTGEYLIVGAENGGFSPDIQYSDVVRKREQQKKSAQNLLDVCHASEGVVRIPNSQYIHQKNTKDPNQKDFGAGFYMCRAKDQGYPIRLYAGFDDIRTIVLNNYNLDLTGLDVLYLRSDLAWALTVAAHRRKNVGSKAVGRKQWALLCAAILEALKTYDAIIGPISDDRMFSVLDDYINNLVSEAYLVESVDYMKYPMQYVFKTAKADKQIKYIGSRELSSVEIEKARQEGDTFKRKMVQDMIKRRGEEREAVRKGNVRGRLFKDVVGEVFSGIENIPDADKLKILCKRIKGWFSDDVR